jgi:hypothetical protein
MRSAIERRATRHGGWSCGPRRPASNGHDISSLAPFAVPQMRCLDLQLVRRSNGTSFDSAEARRHVPSAECDRMAWRRNCDAEIT